jgi:hypothetical protein
MFYFPGFMQDSRVLQLELKLSETQITTLLEKYDDVPNRGGPGCFYLDEPHTCYSLNKSFEFITLGSESQGDDDFEGNHGVHWGVAISEKEGKIIYWIEDW